MRRTKGGGEKNGGRMIPWGDPCEKYIEIMMATAVSLMIFRHIEAARVSGYSKSFS